MPQTTFSFHGLSPESFLTKEIESILCFKVYRHSTGGKIFIADTLLFPTKSWSVSALMDWTPARFRVRTISLFSIIPDSLGESHFQLSTWKRHIFTEEYIWQTKDFLMITNLRNHYQYNVTLQPLNSIVSVYRSLGSAYIPSALLRQDDWPEKGVSYQEIGNR